MKTQSLVKSLCVAGALVLGVVVFRGDSALAGGSCGGTPMSTKMASTAQSQDIVHVAAEAGQFKTLLAAAKAAGLVDALSGEGPLTVFAPTDEAFAKLPKGTVESLLKPENKQALANILLYHVSAGKMKAGMVVKASAIDTLNGQRLSVVVNDKGVMIDGAKVIKTDIAASNGVIHVIDSVMLPTDKDIVDIASGNDQFSTLVAAVKAAGLVEALKGDGPFTVFAPTNEAFAKLPKGTVESLLKPENKDQLIAVLTYHVVPGRVFSDAAAKGATVKTLQGAKVTTKSADGGVKVNDATVVAADIDAANGVIHVIDRVILPPTGEQAAAAMIEQAIAKGVPMFNAGRTHQCAKVYAKTLMALSSHDAIQPQLQRAITHRLDQIANTHGSSNRAWMYRHTLDMVHVSLEADETMQVASTR